MRILALDLSIRCPGWCVADDDQYLASGYQENDKRATVYSRIEKNISLIKDLVTKYQIKAVWMEDTMPSGRGKTSQMLLEQSGIVKYWCKYRKIPVYCFSISDIKKSISGNGNAGKPEMLVAVQARGYTNITQNDEVDAIATWLCGLEKPFAEVANE